MVRVAKLPSLKPRPAKDEKKVQEPVAQKPLMKLTPEMLNQGRGVKAEDLINKANLVEPLMPPVDLEEDEEGKGGKARPGQVTGRDKRHQQRDERARQRRDRQEAEVKGSRTALLTVDEDRPQRLKQRLHKIKKQQGPTQPRKGKVPVEFPITVRALSEAVGLKTGELLFRLQRTWTDEREHQFHTGADGGGDDRAGDGL